jgi:hypothetical protein
MFQKLLDYNCLQAKPMHKTKTHTKNHWTFLMMKMRFIPVAATNEEHAQNFANFRNMDGADK